MKNSMTIILILFLLGCTFQDQEAHYEERLIVFAHLVANLPMINPIYVSRSAALVEAVSSNDLYIDSAVVFIHTADTSYRAWPVPGKHGQYILDPSIIIQPQTTYRLEVSWQGDTVWAETTVPRTMDITSPDSSVFTCDGEEVIVPGIHVDNMDMMTLRPTGPIDTVVYRTGDCYTQSFVSIPYFLLEFPADSVGTIQTITYALEADKKDLEPFSDENGNGRYDSGEPFTDYNRNEVRDSTFVNLIYDTTKVFQLWKGSYLRDEDNNPYRYNPFVWNIDVSPTQMGWLNFNYYGLHIVFLQATDDAFFQYFSGDPMGLNQWVLPDSNIEGGYGMFSSSFGKGFFVYIQREESE